MKKNKAETEAAIFLKKNETRRFFGRFFIKFLETKYKAKIDEMWQQKK
jgi:hypothetical protein